MKGGIIMSTLNPDVEMELIVSPICTDDKGEKYACVTFKEGERIAEGRIPECTIGKNIGFSNEETEGLRQYLITNLAFLKKTAAQQSVFNAFMKEERDV